MLRPILWGLVLIFIGYSCQTEPPKSTVMPDANDPSATVYPSQGSIERLDARLDQLIPKQAKMEVLAKGFAWSEGPVWLPEQEQLLFSDIPPNKIYQWSEKEGLRLYLEPSGYTGDQPFTGGEPGANGLLLDASGHLVLCQHGDRRMARMEAPLDQAQAKFSTLADRWEGKRFNSPNDAVFSANGDLLFTDPPYGLPQQSKDPGREIPFQGVFRRSAETGAVSVLTKELSRPNGIAFSPDEKTLYVSNSDPKRAIWMAYDWDGAEVSNGRVFFDATDQVPSQKGLPDGLKVDVKGNIWATGPGGVWVFSPQAEHLGTLKTGAATANCAFNADQSILYITADSFLLRLKLR